MVIRARARDRDSRLLMLASSTSRQGDPPFRASLMKRIEDQLAVTVGSLAHSRDRLSSCLRHSAQGIADDSAADDAKANTRIQRSSSVLDRVTREKGGCNPYLESFIDVRSRRRHRFFDSSIRST